ncbi:radical SAM protein with 4Fe4S-binding SPASM domain [Prauserella shujinwangii]|uniref:Radical SAM protein with 4Fe4S-binding SPASM domain n=1 Tax=Prauserella shujinwangii TaxID=1453103 RepID=A0A2T0LSN6_9PSEU|nr:radical SAM protein [Prauserella shujinwangii]PRX46633.1 radical SAM protein with 4Fe4S-binding SPASM domain [Prauserella shujinwangii]
MSHDVSWLEQYMSDAKAGTLAAPPSAWWIVTRACNLNCYYCFADARKKDPDELDTAEAMAVLEDFAASGLMFVTFLGGEPLVRKDIYRLVDHSTDLGLYTALLTNGLNVREDKIDRLVDAGLEMIGVSIDSTEAATHDSVRGVRGSLDWTRRVVRHAVRRGVRTSVRIVVSEDSYESIPDLFRWAVDEGVEELILLPMFMVGRAAGGAEDRRADIVGKRLFLDSLRRLRRLGEPLGISVPVQETLACPQGIELRPPTDRHHHAGHAAGFELSSGCKVGRFMISVQPNGDVYPCPFVHTSIGNLRTRSVTDIWRSPLLRRARGEDLGCLARSMIHTGRADVADPTYRADAARLLAELPAPAEGGDRPAAGDLPFVPVDGLSLASHRARGEG